MKKTRIVLTAALVTGLIASTSPTFAIGETIEPIKINPVESSQTDTTNYAKFSGVISSIEQVENSTKLTVDNGETSLQMIFPITDEVLIFNSETTTKLKKDAFEKGQKVEVFYDKYKPMLLIYPAIITPEIVIINEQKLGSVKISKFDQKLLSLDNDLKLNISKETVLLNQQGETIKQTDLKDKELIVFYTFATKSLPAQTTPSKIIALDPTDGEIAQLIEKDHYMKSGTKMVPIRKISERLGYKVEWQGKTDTVLVSKQASSYLISIGKKEYGYNKSLKRFEVTPEIKNGRTYVPESFVDMLLN
jgi:hypothetical protein